MGNHFFCQTDEILLKWAICEGKLNGEVTPSQNKVWGQFGEFFLYVKIFELDHKSNRRLPNFDNHWELRFRVFSCFFANDKLYFGHVVKHRYASNSAEPLGQTSSKTKIMWAFKVQHSMGKQKTIKYSKSIIQIISAVLISFCIYLIWYIGLDL